MRTDLQMVPLLAVLACYCAATTAYAQQSGSGPQPQSAVPLTPEGTPPPPEITPSHPLPQPDTRLKSDKKETTGNASRSKPSNDPSRDNRSTDRGK